MGYFLSSLYESLLFLNVVIFFNNFLWEQSIDLCDLKLFSERNVPQPRVSLHQVAIVVKFQIYVPLNSPHKTFQTSLLLELLCIFYVFIWICLFSILSITWKLQLFLNFSQILKKFSHDPISIWFIYTKPKGAIHGLWY